MGPESPPKLTIDGEDGDSEKGGQKDNKKKKRGGGTAGTVTSKEDDNGGGEGGRPQPQNPMVQEAPIKKKRRLGPAPTIEPPKSRSMSVKEMLLRMAPKNAQNQRIQPTKCDQKDGSKSQSLDQPNLLERHGLPTQKGSIFNYFTGSKSTECNGMSKGQTQKGSVKMAATGSYKGRSRTENQPMLSFNQLFN